MKNVVIAGATGLVGSCLVGLLEGRTDVLAYALVRRAGGLAGSRRHEVVFDHRAPGDLGRLGGDIPCDVLISCLGTTIAKAGSAAAFRAVDHELPALLIGRLKELPARPGFALVSSVGASASGNFYLRTKHETEEVLAASGLPYLIVRPSILDGERSESRPLERAGLALLRPLFGAAVALTGRASRRVGRLRPVPAEQVARALVRHAVDHLPSNQILEGWDLYDPEG